MTDRTPARGSLSTLAEPASPGEVADALAAFAGEGRAVVPIGGGGALALGNATSDGAVGLSLNGLKGVIDYQPTDMTLSVEAGVTLAEITDLLGANGQQLPIEAPYPATATIGGLLATALTGPRRYGGGSLRDVIIGISVAYPDGSTGKAGGMVVKNVSGFDMMRIHYGALGTLGVITSANFKVLPIPRSEFTVTHGIDNLDDADRLVKWFRAPAVRPVALVIEQKTEGWQLAARYEGRRSGLLAVASELDAALASHIRLDDQESSNYWRAFMNRRVFDEPAEVRIQIRGLPTDAIATTLAVQRIVAGAIDLTRIEIEPGTGTLSISWMDPGGESSAGIIGLIRAMNSALTLIVQSAPDAAKQNVDVWGEPPESIEIMRRLKREYDPGGTLNPGRFAGKI